MSDHILNAVRFHCNYMYEQAVKDFKAEPIAMHFNLLVKAMLGLQYAKSLTRQSAIDAYFNCTMGQFRDKVKATVEDKYKEWKTLDV